MNPKEKQPAPEQPVISGGTRWVQVYCTSGNCRGKRNGGKGFEVWVPEGSSPNGNRHFCNECYCR